MYRWGALTESTKDIGELHTQTGRLRQACMWHDITQTRTWALSSSTPVYDVGRRRYRGTTAPSYLLLYIVLFFQIQNTLDIAIICLSFHFWVVVLVRKLCVMQLCVLCFPDHKWITHLLLFWSQVDYTSTAVLRIQRSKGLTGLRTAQDSKSNRIRNTQTHM